MPSASLPAIRSAPGVPTIAQVQAEKTEWMLFGDRQTGQLDKANGISHDVIDIFAKCEAMIEQSQRRATTPAWRRIFMK